MANEIKVQELSVAELNTELVGMEKHYQDLKFKNTAAPLADTNQLKSVRRQIARVHTELRSRELKELEAKGGLKRDKIRARRRKR
jgi:large subunit ribosomal protein L29